jgi:polar amino acid transport system substrate-binding protein
MKTVLPLVVGAVIALLNPAQGRTLDAIRASGVLGLCAHPNSLPFASKAADPPGFQIELGQALAHALGVSLRLDWIITQYQMRSAGCDIVLDVIADREAQGETRLRISKPYYRTGVALAVPSSSALASFQSLNEHTKVGVQVGSVAAMIISQRHVPTSTFGFESDSLTHPDKAFRILDRDESIADLNWNVAVGMVRPDDALRDTIDGVVERLRNDGTIDRIYRRYGVVLHAPK